MPGVRSPGRCADSRSLPPHGQPEIDAKVGAAFDVIHGELGGRTALTLNYWVGPQCYADPWEATLTCAAAMPERVRTGVDHVFLSLYEAACDPVQRPTAGQAGSLWPGLGALLATIGLSPFEIVKRLQRA